MSSEPSNNSAPPFRYTATLADRLERSWQAYWEEHATFRTPNPGQAGFDPSRPSFYCLDMFPYPSGAGLHVGHPEGYTATDILSRYKRMKGFNVLHPMGWDAFGLPAEQYAIQTGVHPAKTTAAAIDNFRRQLKRFGFSYDWSRELSTMDPAYYRWTQWIFLQIYNAWFDAKAGKARPIAELEAEFASGARPARERDGHEDLGAWATLPARRRKAILDSYRLAYLGEQTVNWCPALGTVLANDEVIEGRSERGGHPVVRLPLKQWMFRITAYATRLRSQLEKLKWPASTRQIQEEWIGRSEGAEIDFVLDGLGSSLTVFTTRPDTLFGATYLVVAPEHPLVEAVLASPPKGADAGAIRAYVERSRRMSDVDRMENKEKTGVFTGLYAVNPATGGKIPVWTADYVLMGYGRGAIMAVPAHDERDYEFAKAHGLPIRDVVYPRPIAAMRYFAHHAAAGERDELHWLGVLADFLGLAATAEGGDDRFAQALGTVRTRRVTAGEGGESCDVDAPSKPRGEGSPRREVVRTAWFEAVEGLGVRSFEELAARFAEAQHFAMYGSAYSGDGLHANSSNSEVSLDGLTTPEAHKRIVAWLEARGLGRAAVNYRLRDWTFSRQRYWGEPFPIVYDEQGDHYGVDESALPVTLPPLDDYAPVESSVPTPLLAKAKGWVKTTAGAAGVSALPPGAAVERETNTMPGSAGSSWYCLRYCDPWNTERFIGREAEQYWMGKGEPGRVAGVDLYIGGSEHAVGHLLYARFWHNVLFDLGHVSTPEPFGTLFHQGLITSYSYQRADKTLVPSDEVEEKSEGVFVERSTGKSVTPIVAKMSKSLKNVVNPDEVIERYGADTFRLYEMYMGPLEASKPWNTRDIVGCFRFLQRLWRLAVNEETGELSLAAGSDERVERALHRTIAKVGSDIERLSMNTAIAALMELVNTATGVGLSRGQLERLALILAPFAPHMAEELWAKLGLSASRGSIAHAPWPAYDEAMLLDEAIEVPVQIQGKVRARITVSPGADVEATQGVALSDEKVLQAIAGRKVKKVIVVPGRMVNIVVGE